MTFSRVRGFSVYTLAMALSVTGFTYDHEWNVFVCPTGETLDPIEVDACSTRSELNSLVNNALRRGVTPKMRLMKKGRPPMIIPCTKGEIATLVEQQRRDGILSQRQREEEMIYANTDYNHPCGIESYIVEPKSRFRRAIPSLRIGCGFMVLWGMLARRMGRA